MTLLEARTLLRHLLAEDTAAFWTDAMLNIFIQRSFLAIYTKVRQANQGHFATSANITYVAGTDLYSLPTGIGSSIIAVERRDTTPAVPVWPCDFIEKYQYETNQGCAVAGEEHYYIVGDQIGITPTPQAALANAIRVWFIPVPTLPTADGTTLSASLTDLHHEVIVLRAYMLACARDKDLAPIAAELYKEARELLVQDTQGRQSQLATRVIDIEPGEF